MSINSGDDGIHSDTAIVLDGGEAIIEKSYEGIESNAIVINNGNYHINASDDGINTAGGNDGSAMNGRPGQNNFNTDSDSNLCINGGYIFINAQGDGIDSNGDITMMEGTVLVNGPTNGGNGALDYNGSCNINGGVLIAVGSAGMAQGPSDSSAQNSILVNLDTIQLAGTLIHIKEENGEDILTFAPGKDYQFVVVSSPKLKNGSTYALYTSGMNSGTVIDGLYDGEYILQAN
ncbi:MAG: carbohydrate-binding domain-containing protein [Eubacteriales bacterium]